MYVCLCVCVAFLTVRVRVSRGAMIKAEEGNIKSAVENECGEIAHSAGPAVSLMTSLSCGFHENQTSSRSCFHTKPSSFCDPNAFFFLPVFTTTELIVRLFLHGHFFHLIMCENLNVTNGGRVGRYHLFAKSNTSQLSVQSPKNAQSLCHTSGIPFLGVERCQITCFLTLLFCMCATAP